MLSQCNLILLELHKLFFFLIKTFIEQSQSKYKPSSKYWMHTLPKQEELPNQTAHSLLHN
jgi:hypothetical protein